MISKGTKCFILERIPTVLDNLLQTYDICFLKDKSLSTNTPRNFASDTMSTNFESKNNWIKYNIVITF